MRLRPAGPALIAGCSILLGASAQPTSARDGVWTISLNDQCARVAAESASQASEGALFATSEDGSVHALDRRTGEQQWRFQTGEGMPSGGTQVIVVPNRSDAADMLDAALKGTQARAGGMRKITAAPVVDAGTVYVGSWDHKVYALDATNGALKWSFDAGLPIVGDAVMSAGRVIFATGTKQGDVGGDGDALVVALDASSGKQAWAFDTLPDVGGAGKWPSHPPVLRDDVAFVTNWNAASPSVTYVHAIDATTGAARWSCKVSDAAPSPPAVTQKYVVFMTSPPTGTTKVSLHVLNRSTGEPVWRYDSVAGNDYWKSLSTRNEHYPPAVVSDDLVLLATDTAVAAFDLDTGRERWRVTEPFQSEAANQLAFGPTAAYVITGDTFAVKFGHFYGIDLQTGEVLWSPRMFARNRIRAVFDGVIYIDTQTLGLGTSIVAFSAVDGKDLGTVWRRLPFGRGSSDLCFGPVRRGDRVLMSTSLQEFAGQGSSAGRLYSLALPAHKPTR